MIKYKLLPSPISPDPNVLFARVTPSEIWGLNEIVAGCKLRGTTLTVPDMLAAFDLLFTVIIDGLKEGKFINTPVVNLRPSISGKFDNSRDTLDKKRNKVSVSSSVGAQLRKEMKKAHCQKILSTGLRPILSTYKDNGSGTPDSLITPGNIGSLHGTQLNFNPANEDEGIFFKAITGGAFIKVGSIGNRFLKKLVFVVPVLPSGQYYLIVRKGYGKDANIREGRLNEVLTVT